MARTSRKTSSTGVYRVMIRGNNKQEIFKNRQDKRVFYNILTRTKAKYGFKIYAYAFMGNHVHLLLKEPELGLVSAFMHDLETAYVVWFNAVHRQSGHLFQGRFKSKPVENNEYLANVVRYIHQNPVKSGYCRHPRDYKYCSYYEFFSEKPGLIDPDDVFAVINRDEFEKFNLSRITGNDLKFLDVNDITKPHVPDQIAFDEMRSISQCSDGLQLLGLGMDEIFAAFRKFRKRGFSYRQIAEFILRSKSTTYRMVNSAVN